MQSSASSISSLDDDFDGSASHFELLSRVQNLPGTLGIPKRVLGTVDLQPPPEGFPPFQLDLNLEEYSFGDDEFSDDDDAPVLVNDIQHVASLNYATRRDSRDDDGWDLDGDLGLDRLSLDGSRSTPPGQESLDATLSDVVFDDSSSRLIPRHEQVQDLSIRRLLRLCYFDKPCDLLVTENDLKTMKFVCSETRFYRTCKLASRQKWQGSKRWGIRYHAVARALKISAHNLDFDDGISIDDYVDTANQLRTLYRCRHIPSPMVAQGLVADDDPTASLSDSDADDGTVTFYETLFNAVSQGASTVKDLVVRVFNKVFSWIKPILDPVSGRLASIFSDLRLKIVGYLIKVCDPLGCAKEFLADWKVKKMTTWIIVQIILAILCLLGVITARFLAGVLGAKIFRSVEQKVGNPYHPYSFEKLEDITLTGQSPPATVATAIGTTIAGITAMRSTDKKTLMDRLQHFTKLVSFGVAFSTLASSVFLLLPVAIQTAFSTTFATPEVKERALIDTWLQNVTCYVRMSKIPGVVTSDEYYTWVLEASQRAVSLKDKIKTPAVSQIFLRNYIELMKILTTLTQYREVQDIRRMPFSIHLAGDPGVGKTLIAPHLIRSVFGVGEREIYTRPISDEYWSGYSDQKIIFYDEFLIGDSETRSRMAREYLELVSTKQFMPNMASVDNPTVGLKGTVAMPDGIVTANNSPYSSVDGFDDAAISRRRHIVLYLTTDFADKTHTVRLEKLSPQELAKASWIRVTFLPPENPGDIKDMCKTSFSLDEAISIIKKGYKKHIKTCEDIEKSLHSSARPSRSPQQILHDMLLEINKIDPEPSLTGSMLSFLSNSFKTDVRRVFETDPQPDPTPLVGQGDDPSFTKVRGKKKSKEGPRLTMNAYGKGILDSFKTVAKSAHGGIVPVKKLYSDVASISKVMARHDIANLPHSDMHDTEIKALKGDQTYIKVLSCDYHLSQRDLLVGHALEILNRRLTLLQDTRPKDLPDPIDQSNVTILECERRAQLESKEFLESLPAEQQLEQSMIEFEQPPFGEPSGLPSVATLDSTPSSTPPPSECDSDPKLTKTQKKNAKARAKKKAKKELETKEDELKPTRPIGDEPIAVNLKAKFKFEEEKEPEPLPHTLAGVDKDADYRLIPGHSYHLPFYKQRPIALRTIPGHHDDSLIPPDQQEPEPSDAQDLPPGSVPFSDTCNKAYKGDQGTFHKDLVAFYDHSNVADQTKIHRHICLACGRQYTHTHQVVLVHPDYRCKNCLKHDLPYNFDLVKNRDWLPPVNLDFKELDDDELRDVQDRLLSFYWAYWKARYVGPLIEICIPGDGCYRHIDLCTTHYYCHLPPSACDHPNAKLGVGHTHNNTPFRAVTNTLLGWGVCMGMVVAFYCLLSAIAGLLCGTFRRIKFSCGFVGQSAQPEKTSSTRTVKPSFTRNWTPPAYVGNAPLIHFAIIHLNGRTGTALPVGGRYFLTYRHAFGAEAPQRGAPMTIEFCGQTHKTVFIPECAVFDTEQDTFLYYVPITCRSLPEIKKQLHNFISRSELEALQATNAVVLGPRNEAYVWATRTKNIRYVAKALPGVKNSPEIPWTIKDGFTYAVPCSYGWCASALISNGVHEPGKIIGMHVAGTNPELKKTGQTFYGSAVALCKEYISEMVVSFCKLSGTKPPEDDELPVPASLQPDPTLPAYDNFVAQGNLVASFDDETDDEPCDEQNDDSDNESVQDETEDDCDEPVLKTIPIYNTTGYSGPNLLRGETLSFDECVYVNRTTRLRKSAISPFLDVPCEKQLPLMAANDPRNKTGKDPYFEMIQDTLSVEHPALDESVLKELADDTYDNLASSLVNPIDRELTFEEACCGIPGVLSSVRTSTSVGWPMCKVVRKTGKTSLFWFDEDGVFHYNPTFKEQVERFVEFVRAGKPFVGEHQARFLAFLKDEPTSAKKIEQGRCRLIFAGDVTATVAFRMLFGNILCRFNNSGHAVPGTIGLNQYSYDMDTIYEYIQSDDAKYLAGDFKNFDKHLNPAVAFAAYDVLRRLALPHLQGDAWSSFMSHQTKSPIQAQRALLYLKFTHMSGLFFTTILNCVAVEIMTRYAFQLLLPDELYYSNIRLKCLGDDHIIAVSSVVQDKTTPSDWQWAFNQLGCVYTAADKSLEMPEKFSRFDEITFLGATPVLFEGRWLGVANASMIWNMLHWTRDKDRSLIQIVTTAVELSAPYDWHDDFKGKLLAIMRYNLGIPYAPGTPFYSAWPQAGKKSLTRIVAKRTAAHGVTFYVGQGDLASDNVQNPPTKSTNLLDEATSSGMVMNVPQRPSIMRPENSVSESKGQLYDGTNARVLRTTYTWTNGFVGEIAAIEVPFGLISLGTPQNLQNMPFDRHIYFVGKPVVQVTIQGTPFHQGLLYVFFVPLDREVPDRANWSCMCPVVLEPARNSTGVLECPFVFTRDMMNTLIQNGAGSLGRVIIASFVALSSVQATPVDIIVSSSFDSADFRIPRPLTTRLDEIVEVTPEEREHLPAKVIVALGSLLKVTEPVEETPSDEEPPTPSQSRFKLATEYSVPGYTHVTGCEYVAQGNQVSHQVNSYTVTNVAGTSLDTGSLNNANSSSPSQTVDAAATIPLPFHNPPLASGAVPTTHQHSSMSATTGVRPVTDMQMHPATMFLDGKRMLDNGESKIARILGKPSVLNQYVISSTTQANTNIGSWVANSVFQNNVSGYSQAPANVVILNQFQFWRCDVIYTFQFVGTDYHAVRIQAVAAYGTNSISATERNVHHSAMINFNADNRSCSFRVPYNNTLRFLRTASRSVNTSDVISDEVHHSLSLYQMTRLLRPDTVSATGTLIVFVSFDNVEVCYPLEATPFLYGPRGGDSAFFTYGRIVAQINTSAVWSFTFAENQYKFANGLYLLPNIHMIVTLFAKTTNTPYVVHVFANTELRRPCPQVDSIARAGGFITVRLTPESASYLPLPGAVETYALVTIRGNSANFVQANFVAQGDAEGLQEEVANTSITATDSDPPPAVAPPCEITYGQHFDSSVTDLTELLRRMVYIDPMIEPFVSWKAFTSLVRSPRGNTAWMNVPTCPRHPLMAFFAAWSGTTIMRIINDKPFYVLYTSSNEIVGTQTTVSYPMMLAGAGYGFNTYSVAARPIQPVDIDDSAALSLVTVRAGALERSFQNGPNESVLTVSTPFTTAYNFCATKPTSRWPSAPGSIAIEIPTDFPEIFVAGGDDIALGMYCPPAGMTYTPGSRFRFGSNGYNLQ